MDIQTPIHRIEFNTKNNTYIKRDDLLPFSFGGNKVRISDEFFNDMNEKGADCIIGYGNSRSNLCRVLANRSNNLGIKCCIISPKDDDGVRVDTNNSRIVEKCNSDIVVCEKNTSISEVVENTINSYTQKGYCPYYIYGNKFGSGNKKTPVKAYNKVYKEIFNQSKTIKTNFDYIFLATGTGMTQAGLLSGLIEKSSTEKIIGISVAREKNKSVDNINQYLKCYFDDLEADYTSDIYVCDDFLFGGYGKTTSEIEKTIDNMLVSNGVPLDPTYTGKAFTGMINYLNNNNITDKNILFIHTGGTPLFFDNL